jgi:hypothetical protein
MRRHLFQTMVRGKTTEKKASANGFLGEDRSTQVMLKEVFV